MAGLDDLFDSIMTTQALKAAGTSGYMGANGLKFDPTSGNLIPTTAKGGFLSNILPIAGDLMSGIAAVYAAPRGTPGIIPALASIANRVGTRGFLNSMAQNEQAKAQYENYWKNAGRNDNIAIAKSQGVAPEGYKGTRAIDSSEITNVRNDNALPSLQGMLNGEHLQLQSGSNYNPAVINDYMKQIAENASRGGFLKNAPETFQSGWNRYGNNGTTLGKALSQIPGLQADPLLSGRPSFQTGAQASGSAGDIVPVNPYYNAVQDPSQFNSLLGHGLSGRHDAQTEAQAAANSAEDIRHNKAMEKIGMINATKPSGGGQPTRFGLLVDLLKSGQISQEQFNGAVLADPLGILMDAKMGQKVGPLEPTPMGTDGLFGNYGNNSFAKQTLQSAGGPVGFGDWKKSRGR